MSTHLIPSCLPLSQIFISIEGVERGVPTSKPHVVRWPPVICVQMGHPIAIFVHSFIFQIPRCAPCPAGYSCGNVTQPPVPCNAGYYSLQGDASCTECEAGQACTDPGQAPKDCSIGTYSQKVCRLHSIKQWRVHWYFFVWLPVMFCKHLATFPLWFSQMLGRLHSLTWVWLKLN